MLPRMRVPLLIAAFAAALHAQDPAVLATAAKTLCDDPALRFGRCGIVVADAATGADLLAIEADKLFMPASNMKLISGVVALYTLGTGFTYKTRLWASGDTDKGVITGDLLLVGDGDPTFGGGAPANAMFVFAPMVDALQRLGIQVVKGRVLGVDDCQCEEHVGAGWQWDYLQDDYAAQFSGLNFADNVTHVFVGGDREGLRPHYRFEPMARYAQLGSEARCGGRDSAWTFAVTRSPSGNMLMARGSVPADAPERDFAIAVDNPTRYAAQALATAVLEAKIHIAGGVFDADEVPATGGKRTEIAVVESEPLPDILAATLQPSQNLYAEQLWRTATQRCTGDSDTRACADFSKTVLAGLGVDVDGMQLADGSGLSRGNLVRPRQLVQLLLAVQRGELLRPIWQALPVAGDSGTLRHRFTSGPARGHVRAKTGSIGGVACLSGYIERPGGKPPLVFAIMLNQFVGDGEAIKAPIDAFVQVLAAQAGWPAN